MTDLNCFHGKRVLITGHNGFKGTWLLLWLEMLGAEVYGISLPCENQRSHYKLIQPSIRTKSVDIDIRGLTEVARIIESIRPDFIFHLAAQALVHRSYYDPSTTWTTNVLGTLNILEALRHTTYPTVSVLITSDKCYENNEWIWGYRESDQLGGSDPYSASKAAAELVISSYIRSFFSGPDCVHKICSARAGNVIGGGDWSEDRLIPDCVRSWEQARQVDLRSPNSTRPWQHVLEPLSGYLTIASKLSTNSDLHGEAFNFGPPSTYNHTVLELVQCMAKYWEMVSWRIDANSDASFKEAGLLKLNCDKAHQYLGWKPTLTFEETVKMTVDWYKTYCTGNDDVFAFTCQQIREFQAKSTNGGLN